VAVVVAAAAYLVLRKPSEDGAPSFTISVSPNPLTVHRGSSENITVSYSPNVPSNLNMGSSTGSSEIQVVTVMPPSPFTFTVNVSENAVPDNYIVTMQATDVDTGASTTTTFTVVVLA